MDNKFWKRQYLKQLRSKNKENLKHASRKNDKLETSLLVAAVVFYTTRSANPSEFIHEQQI